MFGLSAGPLYVVLALLPGALAGATSSGSCYDMSTHAVACNVTEPACSGQWYAPGYVSSRNGCCHCQASCENISDACSYYDSAGSCYDMSTHAVTCNVAESACSSYWYAPGYVSSRNGCCHCRQSCENTSDACSYYDDDAATTTTGPPAHGCYDSSTHQCACGGTERECAASGGTWTDGCSSCNGGTTSTMTTTPEVVSSASTKLRPGAILLVLLACALLAADAGTGCYDHIDAHKCDCTVDEQHCTEVRGHTWIDGCRSCDAGEGIAHPDCDREHSWGCFSQEAHACECTVSQVTCNANMSNGMSWTHQCWSCCHHSVWGCYKPGSGCLCDITEGACNRDFPGATWSFRCHECMAIDADPTLTGDGDKDDGDKDEGLSVILWISGSSIAVLTVVAASLSVYCVWQRKRLNNVARSTGGPGDTVVVGSPLGAGGQAAAPNVVGSPKAVA